MIRPFCRLARFTTIAAAGMALTGCGLTRSTPDPQTLEKKRLEYQVVVNQSWNEVSRDVVTRMMNEQQAFEEGRAGPAVTDILILSGGGDFGAFGAGVLEGWGQVKDPEFARPKFDIVTGVSTGALIAPFAFVGSDEAIHQIYTLYQNPRDDWVRLRSWFFFLPGNPSFMNVLGLERDLKRSVTKGIIAETAQGALEHRVIAIGTTNVDIGAQRPFNLGTEAVAAMQSNDMSRIYKILMASAAIPGAFPPVEIDNNLYVDGGTTSNILFGTDPRDPKAPINVWNQTYPERKYPKIRYWVVINNQLSTAPLIVQPRWPSVVSTSLSTSIRWATIMGMRLLERQVELRRLTDGTDLEFRYIAIPDDWRAPKEGTFVKETMTSLAELGFRLGADPSSWKTQMPPI